MTITLSNRQYDVFKFVAMILLPSIGSLYFAIAQVWGLPYGEEVVGTITAIDTFLGLLVHKSASDYTPEVDGTLHVTDDDQVVAAISTPTEDSINKGVILLAVKAAGRHKAS